MNEEQEIEGQEPEGELTPPPVITDVAPAETVTLSKADLADMIQSGVIKAMEGYAKPEPKPEPVATAYDPTAEAINAVRASTRMQTEALGLFPDLPEKYRAQIQDKLELVAPDQIATFKAGNFHKTIARDIAMTAIEEGEYTPPKFKARETPRVEPIGGGGGGSQGSVPKEKASEINELFAFLGLPKPDDKKLSQAHGTPAGSGLL